MNKIILAAMFFFFGFCPVAKAEVVSLSLDEAIAIASRDNRDILLKAQDVEKAKLKIAEARAGLLPTVSVTAGWTDTRELAAKDTTAIAAQASLRQYIYKGGKIINTIKLNEHGLESAQAILDQTKLELILSVKTAFYALQLANAYSRLNKHILDNVEDHFLFIRERYRNGQASASDLLTIKASVSRLASAYEASLNQIESLQVSLKNLLYLDERVRITPQGRLNYEWKQLAYDEGLLKAMSDRPEIRRYEVQEKSGKNAIEIARADQRPSIYASWDYYTRNESSSGLGSSSRGWQDYNVIGVTFSWPIFDGWATKAKVEQAIVDLKETRLMKDKVVRDIALELKNAYLSFRDALAALKTSASEIEVYQANLLTVKQRYQRGIASTLDLDDAALKYDVSLFNKVQAVYDYQIAKSQFEKAKGEF